MKLLSRIKNKKNTGIKLGNKKLSKSFPVFLFVLITATAFIVLAANGNLTKILTKLLHDNNFTEENYNVFLDMKEVEGTYDGISLGMIDIPVSLYDRDQNKVGMFLNFNVSNTGIKNTNRDYLIAIDLIDEGIDRSGDLINLIEEIYQGTNNRVGVVFNYDNYSYDLASFTSDREIVDDTIYDVLNGLHTSDLPENIYKKIYEFLENNPKQNGRTRDVIVITNKQPNIDKHTGYYKLIKKKHPDVVTTYSLMGDFYFSDSLKKELKAISDRSVYFYDSNGIVLNNSSEYTDVQVTIKLSDYVELEEYKTEMEDLTITEENGGQIIKYSLPKMNNENYRIPTFTYLKIKNNAPDLVPLIEYMKVDYKDENGTNRHLETTEPLVKAIKVKVTFNYNPPPGCVLPPTVSNTYDFDTLIQLPDPPVCEGYHFRGWGLMKGYTTDFSSTSFLPRDAEIVYTATWDKITVEKRIIPIGY